MVQSILYLLFWLFKRENLILHGLQQFYFPLNIHELWYRWYTLVTYQFMHHPTSLSHIFLNMLTLFFVAPLFNMFLTEKRILPVYLVGGVFGAFFVLIVYSVFPAFNSISDNSYLYGASASIMAVLFAATAFQPTYEVFVFSIFRIKILYLSLLILLIEVFSITSNNHGGHLSHIGGAVFGFGYVFLLKRNMNILKPVEKFLEWVGTYLKWPFSHESNIRLVYTKYSGSEEEPSRNNLNQGLSQQETIDKILDKISRSGYESLSNDEKETLKSFSK